MSYLADAERVAELASEAFGWRERPPILSQFGGEEAEALNRYFRGVDPASMKLEDLRDYPHDVSAITAFFCYSALLYFLPGLIRISVMEHQEADVLPLNVLLAFSARGDTEADSARVNTLVSAMTKEEKAAVETFVGFMRQHYGADYPFINFDSVDDLLA